MWLCEHELIFFFKYIFLFITVMYIAGVSMRSHQNFRFLVSISISFDRHCTLPKNKKKATEKEGKEKFIVENLKRQSESLTPIESDSEHVISWKYIVKFKQFHDVIDKINWFVMSEANGFTTRMHTFSLPLVFNDTIVSIAGDIDGKIVIFFSFVFCWRQVKKKKITTKKKSWTTELSMWMIPYIYKTWEALSIFYHYSK